MASETGKRLGVVALTAVGYFLCAWLGYAYALRASGISIVWPASGFMVALLALSRHGWPAIVTGGFLGNLAAAIANGTRWPVAAADSAANTFEVVLAAFVLVRLLGQPITLATLRQAGTFILGAAVVSNAVSAVFGGLVLMLAGGAPAPYAQAWFAWWASDGLGMLIVTPPILTWAAAAAARQTVPWTRAIEAVLIFAAVAAVAHVIHHQEPVAGRPVALDPYMVFPLLFWAAIRLGPAGGATATFVLAGATLWNAAAGIGPFVQVGHSPTAEVLHIYSYLTIASLSSLIAASAVHERRGVEESHARLARILDAAPDFVTIGQVDGPPLYINRAAREAFGLRDGEPVRSLLEFRPAGFDRFLNEEVLPAVMRDGSWSGDTMYVSRAGRRIPVSQVTVAHTDADGRVLFLSTISRDITERERADARIRLLASAIESTSDMVSVTDPGDRITFVNPAFLRTYGYSADEVIGQSPDILRAPGTPPDLIAEVAARSQQDGWQGELRNRRKDGSEILIGLNTSPIRDAAGRLVGVLGVARDITEQRALEEQLRQAQKMEAVGQLAGGVAHDFNNALTAILGYADVLAWDRLTADEHRAAVDAIRTAGTHAANLTKQLLAFGRRQVLQPKLTRLSQVLDDLMPVLRRLMGEHIAVHAESHADPRILADVTQIEQIVLNLAVNAADAMPDGGELTLAARGVDLGETVAATHPDVTPGPYACLEVRDTGVGMDEATRARIFEPFFTTKSMGRGTGLGLATVYGIVRQMRGTIDVESEPGRGTTFRIYLPAQPAEPATARGAGGTDGARTPVRGGETVLLVEDEPGVRAFATRVLERYGYRVLAAGNPNEALRVIDHADAVDLVLTDMRMPGGTGPDLAASLRSRYPGLRVLYMSGYTDLAERVQGKYFLSKPFGVEELAAKVRAVLDTAP